MLSVNSQSQTFRLSLRNQYGPDILNQIRALDRLTFKLANCSSGITFLMECRDMDLIPNGLRLKDPCGSARSARIIRRTEVALLRNQINLMRYKKWNLRREINSKETHIHSVLRNEDWVKIKGAIDRLFSKNLNDNREVQDQKLNKLMRQSTRKQLDMNKVVINKSNRPLTAIERSVLAKGMNFAVAPRRQPAADIITSIECAASFLPESKRNELTYEVKKAIENPRRPKENLSKQEILALKCLRNDDNIVIMPADKGKAAVVMDKTEYDTKIEGILSDAGKFTKLRSKNPITHVERKPKD